MLLQFPRPIQASLKLFNVNGQLLQVFFEQKQFATGDYNMPLERAQLPQGIYFLQLRSAGATRSFKLVLE